MNTTTRLRDHKKKVICDREICFATWNIGTVIGKPMKILDIMVRSKINFICI